MRISEIKLDVEPGDRFAVEVNPDFALVKVEVHPRPLRNAEGGLCLWMTTDTARALRDSLTNALALHVVAS